MVNILVLLLMGILMSIYSKKVVYLWGMLINIAALSVFYLSIHLLVSIGVKLPYRLFIEFPIGGVAIYIAWRINKKIIPVENKEQN
ncbi:hypothetical protein M3197_12185 [Sporosarcina aquimarina]|uniref:hypothetical protein n=1 Tax=Sporosarcina aquimarina TaxID=114975 RepID=UPI00203C1FFD|nr:hypothetical protein [Sporosarcina aquimarina]MCM3758222.1 hypothetical protein [Sporosarcina aquimarina]